METSNEESIANAFLKMLQEFLKSVDDLVATDKKAKRVASSKIIRDIISSGNSVLNGFKEKVSNNEEIDWFSISSSIRNISDRVNQLKSVMPNETDLSLDELNELEKLSHLTEALVAMSKFRDPISRDQILKNKNNQVKERENLINLRLEEFEKKFEQNSRSLESISQNASSQMQDMQGSARAALENLKRTYEEESKEFSEKNNKTDELLRKLSTGVLLGGHSGRAIAEIRQANIFRVLTIILMIGVIIFAYDIYKSASETTSYISLATRIGMIFAVLLLITYFARESGKHRVLGNRYYQTALDLKALDPYISDLSVEVKERVKAELAIRMFFVYDNREVQESAPLNAQEIIMKLMDLASKNKG